MASKKASTTLVLSFIVWTIFGVILFSLAVNLIFSLISNPARQDIDELRDIQEDFEEIQQGRLRQNYFRMNFAEGLMIFFETAEPIKVSWTLNNFGKGLFGFHVRSLDSIITAKGKDRFEYVFKPSQACIPGSPCVCVFRELNYEEDPRLPEKSVCVPLKKPIVRPKSVDTKDTYFALYPDYFIASGVTENFEEGNAIRGYDFKTNSSGDIILIDRWALFKPINVIADIAAKVLSFNGDNMISYITHDDISNLFNSLAPYEGQFMMKYFPTDLSKLEMSAAQDKMYEYILFSEFEFYLSLVDVSPLNSEYSYEEVLVLCIDPEFCELQEKELNPYYSPWEREALS